MSNAETALVPLKLRSEPHSAATPQVNTTLTLIEKSAIILTAIGPEAAQGFLRQLGELDMQRFASTIARLGRIDQDVLDAVIFEFLEALMSGPDMAGGVDAVRKLLTGVLDENQLERLLDGIGRDQVRSIWGRMNETPPAALATLLAAEHPQAAAVIISELRPEIAAVVLERLDRGYAQMIVSRLARVPTFDAMVSSAIQGAIERDFLSVLQRNLSKRRPADLIAGLMNNLSTDVREAFLAHIESQNAELAQAVIRTMFTFDDIAIRVYARDVASIVREVEEEVLLMALKLGVSQSSETVRFVFDNLPRRLSERYVEDVGAMDPVSPKEGEAAQIELTKAILALSKAGTIKLIDKDSV